MRLRPATLVLLGLAAAAGAEEPPGAPLADSKQALKELAADQAAKPDAAAGRITDSLPRLQTPTPGAVVPDYSPTSDARKNEQALKKKKEAQQNWLVDGVERLGRDAKGRTSSAGPDRNKLAEGEEEMPDSSDPDYMLKLYNEQKKREESKAEARQAAVARSDPIAPFLQGWLGDNSPVRGRFFDEFARKTDGGVEAVSPAGPADSVRFQVAGGFQSSGDPRQPTPVTVGQPNPYLVGPVAPPTSYPDAGRADPALAAPVNFGGPPPAPAGDPFPAARPADKRPPLPAISDNEKYFPQLKKF